MIPDKQLVKNITDLFSYSQRFKKTYLIADKDDGMYEREKMFANFLAMCGLHVRCEEVRRIEYNTGGI